MMRTFSSLEFLETVKKCKLSVDIRASRLQSGNDSYDDIVDSLEDFLTQLTTRGDGLFVNGSKEV